ncbi:MAG TPA: hypothetical protein PLW35_15980, partial [Verrucomicrobiota bacterium]|nr:hypothetical protein [Verrucomicrobiota bacterium]
DRRAAVPPIGRLVGRVRVRTRGAQIPCLSLYLGVKSHNTLRESNGARVFARLCGNVEGFVGVLG